MSKRILIVNGPNINMLGKREPSVYGNYSFSELEKDLKKYCDENNLNAMLFQSNSEAEIVNFIQKNGFDSEWLIINPAAYTHTSVAIRDAILSVSIKTIEVHISNIFKREEFRHKSFISDIAEAVMSGFGTDGYFLAIDYILRRN